MADAYAYSTPDERAVDPNSFAGGPAAFLDTNTGSEIVLPNSNSTADAGTTTSSSSDYSSGSNESSTDGFFNDAYARNRALQNQDEGTKGNGSTNKSSKDGKNKSVVFGNTLEYDKTYVYSIIPDKEYGVFYKTQIIPVDGDESKKIGNDHLHEDTLDAIVTAVNVMQSVRQQINYTLGNTAYLYVFGENVVELTIGGFGFWKCKTGNDSFKTPDAILDFYKTNNVSKEGKYCKVLLGERIFKGYLLASEMGFTERELGLVSFRLSFIGVFQDNG